MRKLKRREEMEAINTELHVRAVEAGKTSYTNVLGNEVELNTEAIDVSWL